METIATGHPDCSSKDRADSLCPPKPRLTLRVGFAGSRRLDADAERRIRCGMHAIIETMCRQLDSIDVQQSDSKVSPTRVTDFYDPTMRPQLRLVTGLCEGGDAIAAEVLHELGQSNHATASESSPPVDMELDAVLPFPIADYRASRDESFRPQFDRLLQRCGWVLELDGIYDKPTEEALGLMGEFERRRREGLADNRRARGYRAQGAFVLRQSDVLIAAADPSEQGAAGGTLETVRNALDLDMPVVFIDLGNDKDNIHILEPSADMHSSLTPELGGDENWAREFSGWVRQLVADTNQPQPPRVTTKETPPDPGVKVLQAYFDCQAAPPRDDRSQIIPSFRENCWAWFCGRFDPNAKRPKADRGIPKKLSYRDRAAELGRYYSGLYRGAFFTNYLLAIATVTLATFALCLIGGANHTNIGAQVDSVIDSVDTETDNLSTTDTQAGGKSDSTVADQSVAENFPTWLLGLLFVLGSIKLLFVLLITANTQQANEGQWNERSVDFRYLAERLRGIGYLGQAGSNRPPSAAPTQFASRVAKQSAVDWFFMAIARDKSPADVAGVKRNVILDGDMQGVTLSTLLVLKPLETATAVRDQWIKQQHTYHTRNSQVMHNMHDRMKRISSFFGWSVIVIIVIDLMIILIDSIGLLGGWTHVLIQWVTPAMIFLSAVLPAIAAALAGIRFQSECERLAERSDAMKKVLCGADCSKPTTKGGRFERVDSLCHRIESAKLNPDTDLGSWAHEVLRVTEQIATDFVQEVAEWSVLYAKDVRKP